MKTKVLAMVVFIAISIFNAQGIEFNHNLTFSEALKKAKNENKLIFLDAYTTWCGPCKIMSNEVFTQKEVGDLYNSKFVNMKIDMEKEQGISLANKYKITAYPTLLFIDGEGNVVLRSLGSSSVKQFIELGESTFSKEKIESYNAKVTNEELLERKYNEIYTLILEDSDKEAIEKAKKENPEIFDEISLEFKLRELSNVYKESHLTADWLNYIAMVEKYFNSKKKYNDNELNNIACDIYENYSPFQDNNKGLELAKKISKVSLESSPTSEYYLDTYAHILYSLSDIKGAIEFQTRAVEMGLKNGNEDIENYKLELKKFENNLKKL